MKNTQRRREILEIIERQGGISVGEIAEHFRVSKMTGHRDLEYLEGKGSIKRIFGGAVLAASPTTAGLMAGREDHANEGTGSCSICKRMPLQNLRYLLVLQNGEQRMACCPHCGISTHLVLRDQIAIATAADYLTGSPHPVSRSCFLLGSSAAPCCHPSILTFEDLEMARRFQAGFGGTLGRLEDAMVFLQEQMSAGAGCPSCAQPNSPD